MPFTKFIDNSYTRLKNKCKVTIYPNGKIVFNSKMMRLWFKETDFIDLYINEATKTVAFVPVENRTEGTLHIHRGNSSDGFICSTNIMRWLGVTNNTNFAVTDCFVGSWLGDKTYPCIKKEMAHVPVSKL